MSFLLRAQSTPSKQRLPLALGALVAIVVWACDVNGWLNVFDNAVYDVVLRVQMSHYQPPIHTVLCYVEPGTAESAARLDALIQRIAAAQPRGIATTFPVPLRPARAPGEPGRPGQDPEMETMTLMSHTRGANFTAGTAPREVGGELAGQRPWVLRDVDVIARPTVNRSPESLRNTGPLPRCVVVLPLAPDGVHRWHPTHVWQADAAVPTLEARIAARAGVDVEKLPAKYRIQFRDAVGSLPFVGSEDVMRDSVVPRLFTDRVVLLGRQRSGPYEGIVTPTTDKGFLMSPLEYHGHALNTLLSGRAIHDLAPYSQLGLLLAVGCLLPRLHRRSRLGPGVWFLAGAGLLTLVFTAIALRFGCLWLRPASLLWLQGLSCFVTWETEVGQLQRTTRAFCLNVISDQRRQSWPSQFVSSDDPWENVAKLFSEWLSPCRCVLLRVLDQQMYVRETKSFGYGPRDIVERRRDLRRDPYDRANEEGRPIQVTPGRPFFAMIPHEVQYVAPLKFRGKLVGFAAVGVRQETLDKNPEYLPTLQRLADQAAEMLQRRRELHDQQAEIGSRADESNLESWQDLLATAAISARRLSGKLHRLEGIIAVAPHASLVFDLYGNLLLSNSRMRQTLVEEGLSLERESTQTLIAKLWGERTEELRKLVREMVAQGEPYVCPVSLPASGTACFFHLTPVPARAFGGAIDDVYPFGWVGIRLDLFPAVGVGTADWLADSRDYASPTTSPQQLVAPGLTAPNTSEHNNHETA